LSWPAKCRLSVRRLKNVFFQEKGDKNSKLNKIDQWMATQIVKTTKSILLWWLSIIRAFLKNKNIGAISEPTPKMHHSKGVPH
jgi:hypothetical protein